jgi:hypothetical protein
LLFLLFSIMTKFKFYLMKTFLLKCVSWYFEKNFESFLSFNQDSTMNETFLTKVTVIKQKALEVLKVKSATCLWWGIFLSPQTFSSTFLKRKKTKEKLKILIRKEWGDLIKKKFLVENKILFKNLKFCWKCFIPWEGTLVHFWLLGAGGGGAFYSFYKSTIIQNSV